MTAQDGAIWQTLLSALEKNLDREATNGIELEQWITLMGEMDEHLESHQLSRVSEEIRVSPMLELDAKTEQFVGSGSTDANQYLNREYRKGYEVPELG